MVDKNSSAGTIAYEELQGNTEKAVKFYRMFLNLWKHTDRDLPALKEAQAGLERLFHIAIAQPTQILPDTELYKPPTFMRCKELPGFDSTVNDRL